MREIKFRAWSCFDEFPEDACMLYVGDSHGTSHPLDCCKYLMDGQPVTLMQYTGLKDKNGVEIYEGDICVNKTGRICECIYLKPAACFDFVPLNEDGDISGYEAQMWRYRLTVVGNVHEHPELLK